MERRDILKYAASITGAAICAPLTASLLTGCDSPKAPVTATLPNALPASNTAYFESKVFNLITQIMDVILPRTDTPSASDVEVNLIMDNMFNKVFKDGYRKSFLKKFTQLQDHLSEQGFNTATPDKQLAIIKAIEETPKSQQTDVYRAYIDIKQQTISYYLTTETVAEKHLNYLPIPGGYIPCITVKEVGGKAWAI